MSAQPEGTVRDEDAQIEGGEVKLEHEQIYQPAPGERQLTLRAVFVGCLIGAVVGAMNISLGLKIGWSFGGSIIAAILGYAVFAALRPSRPFGVLETNITQTTGSAAGAMASAAGMLAPIPALAMLDEPIVLNYLELTLWCLAVGYLGIFFAVPLRRQMVVVEKLRFPSGTATAETIVSIFAEGSEAIRRAKVLLIWAMVAAAFVLLKFAWTPEWIGPLFESPPLVSWAESAATAVEGIGPLHAIAGGLAAALAGAAAWGFVLMISPVMTGAGLLIGPRVGISLLAGAIVGWGVLAPYVDGQGWVTGPLMNATTGARAWILWPGVAIMVADALTSLALSWRTILNTFRRTPTGDASNELDSDTNGVPNSWWMIGLLLGSTATVLVTWQVFGIAPWMSVIAIALSAVLAAIAVRSTGETDINPVGGMGKVTQLAFAGLAPGQITTNLMTAAVSGAGASQAGDMMHDLKAGRMLGASPRRQIIAQCIGITAGIAAVVPVYWLFSNAYEIGVSEEYPAPAAIAWKGMADLLAGGIKDIQPNAQWAILAGLIFGSLMPILRKVLPKTAPYTPSGLAFGIAFIVPPAFPVAMFLGSMVLVVWRNFWPMSAKALVFAAASGLIAGEGVMNVLTAAIELYRQLAINAAAS